MNRYAEINELGVVVGLATVTVDLPPNKYKEISEEDVVNIGQIYDPETGRFRDVTADDLMAVKAENEALAAIIEDAIMRGVL